MACVNAAKTKPFAPRTLFSVSNWMSRARSTKPGDWWHRVRRARAPGGVEPPLGGDHVVERAFDDRAEVMLELEPAEDDALREQRRGLPGHVGEILGDGRGRRLSRRRARLDDEEELRARVREEQLQLQVELDGEAAVRLPHRLVDVQEEQLALEIQRVERVRLRRAGKPIPEATVAARVAERIEIAAATTEPAGHEQRCARRILEDVARIRLRTRQRHGDGHHGRVVNRREQTRRTRELVGLAFAE